MEGVDRIDKLAGDIMEDLVLQHDIPEDKKVRYKSEIPNNEYDERINYQTMLFSLFFRSYFSLIFVLRRRLPINPSECSASRADSTLCPS